MHMYLQVHRYVCMYVCVYFCEYDMHVLCVCSLSGITYVYCMFVGLFV